MLKGIMLTHKRIFFNFTIKGLHVDVLGVFARCLMFKMSVIDANSFNTYRKYTYN